MKAYIYYPNGSDSDELVNYLIYHNTSKEARKMGISEVGYDDDFLSVKCLRRKDLDKFAIGLPRIERDDETLRSAGWRYEDESVCSCCGLGANGMDKYEVCFGCEQCPECGHDDNCEENKSIIPRYKHK